MSIHTRDNNISEHPQTLSMFENYESEFLAHKTIYQTIRAKDDLKAEDQYDVNQVIHSPPAEVFGIPHEIGSALPNNDLIEAVEKESQVDVSDSSRKQETQSKYVATKHGTPHPIENTGESVNSALAEASNPKTDSAPSAEKKLSMLRDVYGLYPHSLSLSISDLEEVLSSEHPDFALQSILGEGGMGTVYQMLQTSLQRSVAMKVAKIDKWDPKKLAQHCHEAQVSGYLTHPHIPPIHMLAHDIEGNPLIIMRKIEGVTWYEIIKDPQHSFWQNLDEDIDQLDFHLDVLEKIAQTLSYAHNQGVIHRDLKPTNVMVGVHGEVYLLDWGIALHLETAYSDHSETPFKSQRFSHLHEQILGSPAYMPAEMARADFYNQGPATDIYFLGANLFYLLTKKAIHRGDTLAGLLRNILTGHLTPIPDSLTPEMKELITVSLITNSQKRLSCAQEFVRLLRIARQANKSRELEAQGAEAYAELEQLVSNNLMLCEQGTHCVENDLYEYIQMLDKYELAHRSYWAAYQIYNQNQQAFDGFTATLTLWLRRFLHLGEIQAARAVFAGIPNPSAELKEEIDSAWSKYLADHRASISDSGESSDNSASNSENVTVQSKSFNLLYTLLAVLVLGATWLYSQGTIMEQVGPVAGPVATESYPNRTPLPSPNSHQGMSTSDQKQKIKQRETKVLSNLSNANLSSKTEIKEPVSRNGSLSAKTATNRDSPMINRVESPSNKNSVLGTLSPKTKVAKVAKEPTVPQKEIVKSSVSAVALPSIFYSYQIASVRQIDRAQNYIKMLTKRLDLDLNDSAIGFWVKSVEIKPGKLVHRIMFGKFESPRQAKEYKKLIGKLKEKVILRKLDN